MTNPIHRQPNTTPQYQGIPPVPDRIFVRDLRTSTLTSAYNLTAMPDVSLLSRKCPGEILT